MTEEKVCGVCLRHTIAIGRLSVIPGSSGQRKMLQENLKRHIKAKHGLSFKVPTVPAAAVVPSGGLHTPSIEALAAAKPELSEFIAKHAKSNLAEKLNKLKEAANIE